MFAYLFINPKKLKIVLDPIRVRGQKTLFGHEGPGIQNTVQYMLYIVRVSTEMYV